VLVEQFVELRGDHPRTSRSGSNLAHGSAAVKARPDGDDDQS
jgi:hypothetical protein